MLQRYRLCFENNVYMNIGGYTTSNGVAPIDTSVGCVEQYFGTYFYDFLVGNLIGTRWNLKNGNG